MTDDLNILLNGRRLNKILNGRRPQFFQKEDDLKKIMQPKTIKSKNNGCGTAPGNLVLTFSYTHSVRLLSNKMKQIVSIFGVEHIFI